MAYKNSRTTILLPIALAVAVIIGILIGNQINPDNSENLLIYPKSNKLNAVLDYIQEEYVDSVSRKDLVETAIPEILKKLDPHSVYIPAKDLISMSESLEGKFDGIGIQFNLIHDTITVINTIHGGPSERKGVMPGDRIVKINDTLVAGVNISTNKVMNKLKGHKGTEVTISIKRKNVDELIDFTLIRDIIPLESVDVAYMINDNTAYIKISKFSRTTYREFKKAIGEMKAKGMTKVILDLRNNSGGYMDAATNIADEFLEADKIIVYTDGYSRKKSITYSTEKSICKNDDVAILINEWSASASEILAGAIQDNDRGLIIGRRSFGKGLVQEPTFFSDGSSIRLTIARYYTPTGRCIQKPYENGLEDYYNDITKRFMHGEFEERDSIKFADSLKYVTPGGRIVYGGGGIMPDFFTPVDTVGITDFYSDVTNKGLVYQFAFDFTDSHRKELSKFDNHKDIVKYLESNEILKQFLQFVKTKKDIKLPVKEIKISDQLISTHLKAYVCRNILDDEGFYPIIQNIDNTLLTAIEKLQHPNSMPDK